MLSNREKLKTLLSDNNLTRREFSKLLREKLTTVNTWLLPITSQGHRRMPDAKLELAGYKIRELKDKSYTDGKLKRYY